MSCTEFFTEQEGILREKVAEHSEKAIRSPIGMAFVTFQNINHARQVLRDHKNSIFNLKFKPPHSKVAMRPDLWRVWYAPPPNDIIWENLSDRRQWVAFKKVVANLFIFTVAFFLTTPQLVVHYLEPILTALKNFAAPGMDSGGQVEIYWPDWKVVVVFVWVSRVGEG